MRLLQPLLVVELVLLSCGCIGGAQRPPREEILAPDGEVVTVFNYRRVEAHGYVLRAGTEGTSDKPGMIPEVVILLQTASNNEVLPPSSYICIVELFSKENKKERAPVLTTEIVLQRNNAKASYWYRGEIKRDKDKYPEFRGEYELVLSIKGLFALRASGMLLTFEPFRY